MLPRSIMGLQMKKPATVFLCATLLTLVALLTFQSTAVAAQLQARPLATTSTSTVSGVTFAEPAASLPIDTRFSQSIQTVAFDLGLTCGQIEALGWSMRANDQARVDNLFTNTAVELNRLGYTVTPQDPAAAAEDITVYTATARDDKRSHKLFVWSAGDAGLLLLMCDAKGQLAKDNGTATLQPSGMQGDMVDDSPAGFGSYQSAPATIDPKKLVGVWEGTYTCRSQGQTGGRLTISRVKASSADEHNVEGTLNFFPTPKNPDVESGSYKIKGSFNSVTQQAYFEPGAWIKQPKGYISKPIIAYFNVPRGNVSAIFQDTTGCTSFEAHLKAGSAAEAAAKDKPAKKKVKKKKPTPKPVEPAPVIEPSADEILLPEPSMGTTAADTAPVTVPETSGDSMQPLPPVTTEAPPVAAEPVTAPVTAPADTPVPTLTPTAPAPAAPPATPVIDKPADKPIMEIDPTKAAPAAPSTPAVAPPAAPVPVPTGPITVPNKTDAALDAIDPLEKAKAELAAGEAARQKAASQLAIPAANAPKPENPVAP